MQSGIGLGRIIFILGAGYTGTIVLQNGKLGDIIADIRDLMKDKSEEGAVSDHSDAIASQVHRLAMEIRQLASARPITILHGNDGGGNIRALIVPAATFGALGYGYMWWKGISFSDLLYVTKANMANAIANMKKHLDYVTNEIGAFKNHFVQRIDKTEGKVDLLKDLQKDIKNEVVDARGSMLTLANDVNNLMENFWDLDEMTGTIVFKQNFGNAGLDYLLECATTGKARKMPDFLKDAQRSSGRRGYLGSSENKSLKGLQSIKALELGNLARAKTDASSQANTELLDNPKILLRSTSVK